MKRAEISDLYQKYTEMDGAQVTIGGWVRTIRDSKALGFIELNDGSCFKGVQIVFEDGKVSNFKEVAKYNVGSAIIVTGKVLVTPNARQPFEIHAEEMCIRDSPNIGVFGSHFNFQTWLVCFNF